MKRLKKLLIVLIFLMTLTQTTTILAKDYEFAWLTKLNDPETERDFYVFSYFREDSPDSIKNLVARHYSGDYAADIYYSLDEVAKLYDELDQDLLEAIIWQESTYNPFCKTGTCYGLMQINDKYHRGRASNFSISVNSAQDWYDIDTNIKVGADLFWDILSACDGNETKALMMYNMGNKGATLYDQGVVSSYAKSVLQKRDIIREERLKGESLWQERMEQIRQKALAAQQGPQKQLKTE